MSSYLYIFQILQTGLDVLVEVPVTCLVYVVQEFVCIV